MILSNCGGVTGSSNGPRGSSGQQGGSMPSVGWSRPLVCGLCGQSGLSNDH